jgi:hypothetical protein
MCKTIIKLSYDIGDNFDNEKLRVIILFHITLDIIESILNYYKTTQHKIMHRIIYQFLILSE